MTRWRWRGNIALLGVALAFVLYPILPNEDVINSDWPAFATGALMIVDDPGQLYDLHAQSRFQDHVTGGRRLVTLGIGGILPFLAPAWVALLAVPFDALGTDLGGRVWILFGLACLAGGLYLAIRPRPPTLILPGFATVPTALMLLNGQLDGIVALGIGAAIASLTVIAIALVLYLAWRVRAQQMRPAIAILVVGGVLASPHSLPADLVLVALGLVIWGRATWFEWLLLSVGALIAALTPAPL